MGKLENKLIQPHSLVIEKTALDLAAVFYEAGRSSGLTSKHKNARKFARANVEKFIPKAVELLMDMLQMPHIPQEQKDLIYDAIMERTNDKELSNIGIPVFKNNAEYSPDRYERPDPIIINTLKTIKETIGNGKEKI